MNTLAAALLCAAPWVIPPAITVWRVRRSRDLADVEPETRHDAPLVSIIVPARDERRNIESCLRAALGAKYPSVEAVVVGRVRPAHGGAEQQPAPTGQRPTMRIPSSL